MKGQHELRYSCSTWARGRVATWKARPPPVLTFRAWRLFDDDLNEWRIRFTLEALQTLDDKWKAVIAAAEYANDLGMLRTLREGVEAKAVKEYGSSITD